MGDGFIIGGRHARWRLALIALLPLAAVAALGLVLGLRANGQGMPRFADADDTAAVAAGHAVYDTQCAQCHGAHLEGQPNWQVIGADSRVRAPPQDETGHSWMHPDAQLFRFVKFSMADVAAPGYVSPMPSFAGTLTDDQIVATLAYIKSRWPVGVRAYQALLNPGHAGMPAAASGGDWQLPADCGLEPVRLTSDAAITGTQ